MISSNLKMCKFIQIRKESKSPVVLSGEDWNNKIISFDEANNLLLQGYNIGLVADKNTIIVDADTSQAVDICLNILPKTYIEKTCSGGLHFIYTTKDNIANSRIGGNSGEIRSNRQYVVIAPSIAINKDGKLQKYEIIEDRPLANISKDKIEELLSSFSLEKKDYSTIIQKEVDEDYIKTNIISKVSSYMKDLITTKKTKQELDLLGFPSRSERDMKIISFLLNNNYGEYILSIL
jgi:hypothetical protein